MEKVKDIIKIIIIAILIILTILFMINLLPLLIILIIIYAIYNYFREKKTPQNNEEIVINKPKTKDMSGMDLALHISEKTNKKSKNIDR